MVNMLPAVSSQTAVGGNQPLHKIRQASQEFEAQLLSMLMAPLMKSFSSVPGEPGSAGAEEYGFLGGHALASALSAGGGIGIADLLARALAGTKVPADQARGAPAGKKVSY